MIKLSICPIKSFLGANDYFFLLAFFVLSWFLTLQKEYLNRSWYWRLERYGKIRLYITHLAWKRVFLKKLTSITYVYLISPSSYNTSSKSLELIIRYSRFYNFGPNWVQIVHFLHKRCFSKVDCYYCLPDLFLHATTFQKNPERTNHGTEGCIILAQIGFESLPQKVIFWKSWPLV